ncbi:MAG TPA: DUF2491 family protein [Plasticicumulans sp.]|uniref:DUF2491 family protein n=2 Tax=Plasticicumulans sp. TaxID=2307179 RepID=UPI002C44EE30|nr:DUF2491 family protein [Plasticicumulans sp.]HMW30807.1 DUF2491 family protein [Plasticicumulans sp.]HNG50964.1 DUF2491 family protein [Plasticicumulans sp.]
MNVVMGLLDSLFKLGKSRVREAVSGRKPERTLPSALGLRIGASVEFDLLPVRMNAGAFRFALPRTDEPMIVTAQGRFELGEGMIVHRFYSDSSTMLQLLCRDLPGLEDQVEEITLYVPLESAYPENREQIHRWVGPQGRIGAPEFRIADGTRYRRIWFDDEPGPASPVRYTEEVFDEPDSFSRPRRIAQEAMLYGREVAPGRSEYLLPALETTDGESSVTVMVGIDLDRSAVRVL